MCLHEDYRKILQKSNNPTSIYIFNPQPQPTSSAPIRRKTSTKPTNSAGKKGCIRYRGALIPRSDEKETAATAKFPHAARRWWKETGLIAEEERCCAATGGRTCRAPRVTDRAGKTPVTASSAVVEEDSFDVEQSDRKLKIIAACFVSLFPSQERLWLTFLWRFWIFRLGLEEKFVSEALKFVWSATYQRNFERL